MKAPVRIYNKMSKKVILALSGGIDSAVSAFLLKESGFEVTCIFMKNWDEDIHCNSRKEVEDAEKICSYLDVNFKVVNFSYEYWNLVFQNFLEEYKQGRTPNPDILCNQEIKFNTFLNYAKKIGGDFIATGHYARTKKTVNKNTILLRGKDKKKDQSYFLHTLSEKQLKQSIFPVGNLLKINVRKIGLENKLFNYNKKDSTGICFIGAKNFKKFMSKYLPNNPGRIEDEQGNCLGEHEGIQFYTIGQRKGLGIGGKKRYSGKPWFIAKKDYETNKLIVVQDIKNDLLYSKNIRIEKIHWRCKSIDNKSIECYAKIRYQQEDQKCKLKIENDSGIVSFQKKQFGVAQGQSVVFYKKEICLGGGIIS